MGDSDCNTVIISILTSLVVKENSNYEINLTPDIIEIISKIDKKLLYIILNFFLLHLKIALNYWEILFVKK